MKFDHMNLYRDDKGQYIFSVYFTDDSGAEYKWVPRWQHVRQIVQASTQTEIMNCISHSDSDFSELDRFHELGISLMQATRLTMLAQEK